MPSHAVPPDGLDFLLLDIPNWLYFSPLAVTSTCMFARILQFPQSLKNTAVDLFRSDVALSAQPLLSFSRNPPATPQDLNSATSLSPVLPRVTDFRRLFALTLFLTISQSVRRACAFNHLYQYRFWVFDHGQVVSPIGSPVTPHSPLRRATGTRAEATGTSEMPL
jgi:hypothetical protein